MKNLKKITCALTAAALSLSLAACGSSGSGSGSVSSAPSSTGSGDKTIVVGTSNFTEVNILGELYTELIEAYTGTALMNLLAQPMNTDKDVVWQTVSDMMMKDHNIYTSAPLGFNNTYVMSVKPETAEAYGLTTLSDLIEKSPELRLGCTVEFIQREDCLPLLESQYNAEFKDVTGLDASLRYTAIENDEVDVVDAFATDALLSKLGLTTLEDDLGFFPPYYAVNFVNADLIQSDPALAEVLSKLDGAIDEATMAAMNAQVDVDGMSAKEVAHQFLVDNGLIPA